MLTKVNDTILTIDSFEHRCIIPKRLIHSEQLKQHIVIFGMEQFLSNSALYGNICLENIKKSYR